ncbi:hypothetical protein [Rhizobium leguminosarum]|uniref:hypothetical protein n=1 Tax=Rhizobium leguminosarum TaxID=384 RepID=UPI001C97E3D5|nr:hypothetical protein [Rhizobium leguminosarum]MBY5827396.1 hypothetical protein [Rhizobium leguminosarum]
MAHAVEADGTMPEVGLPQVAPVVENIDAVEPVVVASKAQVDVDRSQGSPTEMSLRDRDIEPIAREDNALDGGPSVQEQPASVPTRAPKSRPKPQVTTRRSHIPQGPVLLQHRRDLSIKPGSEEELAALEAENRHLKRLMLVKLREENDRLKSMLGRFGGA